MIDEQLGDTGNYDTVHIIVETSRLMTNEVISFTVSIKTVGGKTNFWPKLNFEKIRNGEPHFTM